MAGKSKENSISIWKKGSISLYYNTLTYITQGTIEKIQFHIVFTHFIAATRIKQRSDIQYNNVSIWYIKSE